MSLQDSRRLGRNKVRAYSLYGRCVHSGIVLPAPIACSDRPPYDLHACWGERKAISDGMPAGEIPASVLLADGHGYALVDTGSGYAPCFYQTGACWIDYDLRSVRVHLSPDVHPDIAGLLVVGNVIASVLTLAGESVLHVSAVEIGSSALAFLGSSGMGKSSQSQGFGWSDRDFGCIIKLCYTVISPINSSLSPLSTT